MSEPTVEALCELGQAQLMETRYREAEATLIRAEQMARAASDWDRLSRLYMPLQESRRQRRQRCGDGVVCLDLLADGAADAIDPRHVLENYPHGQLLVAGWGSLAPAQAARALATEQGLYVETFLAAVYPVGPSRAVVIAPFEGSPLPPPGPQSTDALAKRLPDGCIVLLESDLPRGPMKGTPQTFGQVMSIWERLHAPFLAAADAEQDLRKKIELYRRTIVVDYACELAHQKLSATARELARRGED